MEYCKFVITWCSNLFPRASDNTHSRSDLFECSFCGWPVRDFDAQVKTLLYSSVNKMICHLPSTHSKFPIFIFNFVCLLPQFHGS